MKSAAFKINFLNKRKWQKLVRMNTFLCVGYLRWSDFLCSFTDELFQVLLSKPVISSQALDTEEDLDFLRLVYQITPEVIWLFNHTRWRSYYCMNGVCNIYKMNNRSLKALRSLPCSSHTNVEDNKFFFECFSIHKYKWLHDMMLEYLAQKEHWNTISFIIIDPFHCIFLRTIWNYKGTKENQHWGVSYYSLYYTWMVEALAGFSILKEVLHFAGTCTILKPFSCHWAWLHQ